MSYVGNNDNNEWSNGMPQDKPRNDRVLESNTQIIVQKTAFA